MSTLEDGYVRVTVDIGDGRPERIDMNVRISGGVIEAIDAAVDHLKGFMFGPVYKGPEPPQAEAHSSE